MNDFEIRDEDAALQSSMEIYAHEIYKNRRRIEEWESSVLPNRAELIKDAKRRIAHLEERLSEFCAQHNLIREELEELEELDE